MTGSKVRKVGGFPPEEPSPAPTPAAEVGAAKDLVKKQARKKGRKSQIFAGQLNRAVLDFGKSKVGE